MEVFNLQTELRRVPEYMKNQISQILGNNGLWKILMANIYDSRNSALIYTPEEQESFENAGRGNNELSAKSFINDWGTRGQSGCRPTLQTLQDILKRANLTEAHDLVATIINQGRLSNNYNSKTNGNNGIFNSRISNHQSSGSVFVMSSLMGSIHETNMIPNNDHSNEQVGCDLFGDKTLVDFAYEDLNIITKSFKAMLVGSGWYSKVFKADHPKFGTLAIKKLDVERTGMENFVKEVKLLFLLRHPNVVPIIGFSLDSMHRNFCIVCEYIEGGTLSRKLRKKKLNVIQRMKIINGVAEALRYVHSTEVPLNEPQNPDQKVYFVHTDVKSGNILIANDYTPKLCDFGLGKQLTVTTHITKYTAGTREYMPPESSIGTITQKTDIFSFGTVLLEILTGLPVSFRTSEGLINIRDYVTDECTDGRIDDLLDPEIKENWANAQEIYDLARICYNSERGKRPSINEVCDVLNKMSC